MGDTFLVLRANFCAVFAVPADLDVRMKAVMIGAVFLIVSYYLLFRFKRVFVAVKMESDQQLIL